jgi:ATP synthase protein I
MADGRDETEEPASNGGADEFHKTIRCKQARRIRARREKENTFWYGLGMFGTIGWSVAIPTLVGVGLGLWIDSNWPGRVSWTLTLLFLGLALGCFNAWYWVKREREASERKNIGEDDE